MLILGWWPALFCVRDKLFTCGLSATFYLWPECTTNLWPECTTRSPETAPPCVTALRGIVEPVIVVVVPILPIRVLSLLHSLVSDQWSPSYYSHNSLPPRVGRVIFLNFQGPTIRLIFMIVKNKENFENNWRNQSILPFWCLMWTVNLLNCWVKSQKGRKYIFFISDLAWRPSWLSYHVYSSSLDCKSCKSWRRPYNLQFLSHLACFFWREILPWLFSSFSLLVHFIIFFHGNV